MRDPHLPYIYENMSLGPVPPDIVNSRDPFPVTVTSGVHAIAQHRFYDGKIRGAKARHERQSKAFKVKEARTQMVLGLDLTVDKVVSMYQRTLIGRLEYCRFTGPEMKDWMHRIWEPIIGYTPHFFVLINGWFCFHFISEADSTLILEKLWTMQKGSLVLERWYVAFDPETAPIRKRHIWAILLGFPLPWWKLEILIQTANSLGKFVQLDLASLQSFDKICATIMIEVDVTNGLPAEIEIKWGHETRIQKVDYWKISFRCHHCHSMGHLIKTFP